MTPWYCSFFIGDDLMKVILIAGKSGSGKSESANIMKELLKDLDIKSAITGFSKYLKLFAKELINWNGDENNKPREFLQNLGMDLRAAGNNLLIKRMNEDMQIYLKFVDVVIISDVRMVDELEFFKNNYDSITIRINNSLKNKLTDKQRKHITENDLDDYNKFDYVINNDEKLKEKLVAIVKERF